VKRQQTTDDRPLYSEWFVVGRPSSISQETFIVITKRQLGFFILALGLLLAAAVLGVDWLGAGRWGEFGPLQRYGLLFSGLSLLVGLGLIARGNRPA